MSQDIKTRAQAKTRKPTEDATPEVDSKAYPRWWPSKNFVNNIPLELRELAQWVVWAFWFFKGQWKKEPRGWRRRTNAKNINITSRETFGTFGACLKAYQANARWQLRKAPETERGYDFVLREPNGEPRFQLDGFGFVFTEDDPYAGIDLDDCIDEAGEIQPWALEVLAAFSDCYAERSPSRKGIKIFLRGKLEGGRAGGKFVGIGPDGRGAVEIYDRGRYFTVTGDKLPGAPSAVADRSKELNDLYARLEPDHKGAPTTEGAPRPAAPATRVSLSDDTILRKARQAKNGAKFKALFDDGDIRGYSGDQSSADLALCQLLAFWTGKDPEQMDSLFRRSALYRDKWDRVDYKMATISKAIELTQDVYRGGRSGRGNAAGASPGPEATVGVGGASSDDRFELVITTHEHEVVTAACEALCGDPEIYQRAGTLVEVRRDRHASTDESVAWAEGTPRIVELPTPKLRERITLVADLARQKEKDGELITVPAHPPAWLVAAVAARGDWPGIRRLEFVSQVPVLRADGSVIETPGYHEDMGILYEPSLDVPGLPATVTQAQAADAAGRLLALTADFPFRHVEGESRPGATHRAAFLSAVLTPLARFAFNGPAPFFAFDATVAGSGKGLLCDVISMICCGQEMAVTSYPGDDDEVRKRLTSLVIAGSPLVLFDNVVGSFGGPAIDALATARTWQDRLLGKSEMTPRMPIKMTGYITGNNLEFQGDFLRRAVYAKLESREEHPEDRTDFAIPDLRAHVRANRGAYLTDALAILRGYIVAGCPDQGLTPLGSFEGWSRVVRGAVKWSTGFDPCATRSELREQDRGIGSARAFIEGWASLPGGATRGLTVAQAHEHLSNIGAGYETLRSALAELTTDGSLPGPRKIGNYMRTLCGRVVGGRMLVKKCEYQGTAVWVVAEA